MEFGLEYLLFPEGAGRPLSIAHFAVTHRCPFKNNFVSSRRQILQTGALVFIVF